MKRSSALNRILSNCQTQEDAAELIDIYLADPSAISSPSLIEMMDDLLHAVFKSDEPDIYELCTQLWEFAPEFAETFARVNSL